MDYYSNMLAVAVVSLLAAISPGPDFFVVLRNSLVYSRRSGFMTTFGVVTALIAHLTYTLVGIGMLIAESPFIYAVIKYVGVAYLFYLGSKGLISSFKKSTPLELEYAHAKVDLPARTAFTQGFLTNLLNPKCALFFVSLFSQFIDPATPTFVRIEYAFINWSLSFAWFLFLSYLVTQNRLHGKITRFRNYIDRVMGSALILLGAKLLFV
jgi:RhtB (resistance to homoserine/threonine) family protein